MTTTKQTILVEYSLDSLGDIRPDYFQSACERLAHDRGYDVEFREGLHNRHTIDGETSDEADYVVERAFENCCNS